MAHALQNADSPWKLDRSSVVTSRNRYLNIQPWANSRIALKVPEGQCDYVNASPIVLKDSAGHGSEDKYIATQGPKDTSHFWHMVLQESQEPAVVVMLTQTHEGNREKCAQYYPLSEDMPTISLPSEQGAGSESDEPHDPFYEQDQPLASGSLTLVELINDPTSRSEIRKLNLVIGEQTRTVYHYLFKGWPDFAKPEGEDRQALLELIKQTSLRVGDPSVNPRIVHCSAGVGRTGTFIALDYLMKELENGAMVPDFSKPSSSAVTTNSKSATSNGNSSKTAQFSPSSSGSPNDEGTSEDLIYQTVNLLREQRMMMVMNEIQYSFIYEVLREQFEAKYLNDDKPTIASSTTAATQEPIASARSDPNTAESTITRQQDEDSSAEEEAPNSLPASGPSLLSSGERSPKIARKNSQLSSLTRDEEIEMAPEMPLDQDFDIYAGTKVGKGTTKHDEDTVSD